MQREILTEEYIRSLGYASNYATDPQRFNPAAIEFKKDGYPTIYQPEELVDRFLIEVGDESKELIYVEDLHITPPLN